MAKLNLKKVLEDLVEVQWLEDPEEKEKAFDLLKAISQDDSEEAIEFITKLNSAITEIVKGDEVEEITPEEKPEEVPEKKPEEKKEDAPEEKEELEEAATLKTVADVPESWNFVSDSQDVLPIKDMFPKAKEYDAFFVNIKDGEYTDVFGIKGIVPSKEKSVTKIKSSKNLKEEVDPKTMVAIDEKKKMKTWRMIKEGTVVDMEKFEESLDKEAIKKLVGEEFDDCEEEIEESFADLDKERFAKRVSGELNISEKKDALEEKESLTESYYDGFEKYRNNEGAKEVEGVLHKYGVKFKDTDETTQKKLLNIAKKSVMSSEATSELSSIENDLRKMVNESSEKEEKKETIEESVINKAVNLLDGDYESKMMVNDVAMNAANLL